MEETTRSIQNPFSLGERVTIKNQCPKCSSYFVENRVCEACGFRLDFDDLGEPFGEKSFFNLRDRFLHQFKGVAILMKVGLLSDHEEGQKFLRHILKRYNILCSYFFEKEDENLERRKLFLFESREIIATYLQLGGEVNKLWLKLEGNERSPIFEVLAMEIQTHDQKPDFLNFTKKWLSYPFKTFDETSLLKSTFIFRCLLVGSALVGLSFLFFRLIVVSNS